MVSAVVTAVASILPQSSNARWAARQTEQVPVERILKNLESSPKKDGTADEKAMLEFQIGRAQSLAYARKLSTLPVQEGA
ncbi:MAG TPA: hypothetical protein V6C72_04570, partial [Chroococcales cyanobacterium]